MAERRVREQGEESKEDKEMAKLSVKRVPTAKYDQIRKFRGIPFKFIERNLSVNDARRTRDHLRDKGNLVRVIKTSIGYEVWASPKTRKIRRS